MCGRLIARWIGRRIRIAAVLSFAAILFLPAVAAAATDYGLVIQTILERGDAAIQAYEPSGGLATGDAMSRLYFDVFESSGTEFRVGVIDQALLLTIESQFSQVISLAIRGAPPPELGAAWSGLSANLQKASALIVAAGDTGGFWSIAVQSFLILLREGFEAMLIVTALIAYLQRSGAGDKVHAIWIGVGAALLASVATAYILAAVLERSGAQREMIEGVTMLLACVVLLYVSGWLLGKRHAEQWQKYVSARVDQAISTGSLIGLAAAAFLAVFREGAETILFYRALLSDSDGGEVPIAAGFAVAAVLLIGLYFVMRSTVRRLPLKHFFTATAVLLFALAFVFAGKGILELQIAGALPTNVLAWLPSAPLLGIFATVETTTAQLLVLLILPVAWFFMRGNGRMSPQE